MGFFSQNLPATGIQCDVHLGIDVQGRSWLATELLGLLGFKDQAEHDDYLKSPEYSDIRKFAASPQFGHGE